MANIQALSTENFANKYWTDSEDFKYTANDSVCPIVAEELSKVVFNLPAAFIKVGDAFRLASVQGLSGNTNLCIDPNGKWQVGYIPSRYRCHPFRIIRANDTQMVPCADLDNELINEEGKGNAFFDESNQPTEALTKVLDFLKRIAGARQRSTRICAALAKHNLIKPLVLQSIDEKSRPLKGLYSIDEKALNALTGEALVELRDSGALSIAYSQLLSTHQFANLIKLQKIRTEALKKGDMPVELDLDFLHNHGNISFGEL